MAAAAPLVLALDFGGTKLTAATLRLGQPDWLAQRRVFTPAGADQAYEVQIMLGLARDLIEQAGQEPAACGVSFGGPVDASRGLVRLSPHVPGWANVPLADWLGSALNVPVAVDNDANAAALGEFRFGAGQGCQNLLYVTVSTGIGGGWILGGRPYAGADGLAGEIGHMTVRPGGALCPCGQSGCLEAEAAGPAIARRAQQLLADHAGPAGQRLLDLAGGDPANITAQLVSQAAAEGDDLSQTVLAEAAAQLGRGLRCALMLMNPGRVILGGGVTKSGERWWQIVRDTARSPAFPDISVDILPAAFGDDAPLWGAVALAETLLADHGV
jgi:glucokinase